MFVNISGDLLGIDPKDGITYQVSSFGRREKVRPGIVGRFQEKCLDLSPGETFTMADLDGPGVITRICLPVSSCQRRPVESTRYFTPFQVKSTGRNSPSRLK